jgi:hypothetical protein
LRRKIGKEQLKWFVSRGAKRGILTARFYGRLETKVAEIARFFKIFSKNFPVRLIKIQPVKLVVGKKVNPGDTEGT